MTTIQDTLRSFGITRCYKGFQYAAYAIQLAVEDESRLESVTKEIYRRPQSILAATEQPWSAAYAPSLTGLEDRQPAAPRNRRV